MWDDSQDVSIRANKTSEVQNHTYLKFVYENTGEAWGGAHGGALAWHA